MAKKKHLHDAENDCAFIELKKKKKITALCPLVFVPKHDGTFPSLLPDFHLYSDIKVSKTLFSATNIVL